MFLLRIQATALLLVLSPHTTAAAGKAPAYLHLSDVHLDLGGTSKDTDPQLWSRTKAKLRAVLVRGRPSFVLFTGDVPGHYSCSPPDCAVDASEAPGHDADIKEVLTDLSQLVEEAGIPLLYAPGNNDSLAGDYFSFADAAGKTPFSLVPGADYPAVNASEPCGGPPCMVSAPHPALGFFSARPVAGLRVIALNSIVFGRNYVSVDGTSQLDAGNAQLDWLAEQLADAEGEEKVLLAMHIPPGNDAYAVSDGKAETWLWTHSPQGAEGQPQDAAQLWLDRFLDLVSAHRHTIVGLAFGHTHLDELRRLHDRSGSVVEIAISSPAITTDHGNNPGFKLVRYDPRSKELLDFVTYYTEYPAERDRRAWGKAHYKFSKLFGCRGRTIFECLTREPYTPTSALDAVMNRFVTVMHGPADFDTEPGIEVEYGQ